MVKSKWDNPFVECSKADLSVAGQIDSVHFQLLSLKAKHNRWHQNQLAV
jgi:hypothetical protein